MDDQELRDLIATLCNNAENELNERWEAWEKDFAENEVYEVVGGLLARQASLFTNMAQSPPMWNWHSSPVILRTMIDTHITLAWILEAPLERSRKFIYFGLGQMKLEIEHRKRQLEIDGPNDGGQKIIEIYEGWLDSQRWSFLTEVNVGSWSGLTTREMADEAGIIDFYNYCFTPFSAATHSQWHHIAKMNLNQCENPLHRYHRIPAINNDHTDIQTLVLVAKYMWKSMDLFDRKLGVSVEVASSYDLLYEWLSGPDEGEPQVAPE
ncbi:MAG: DUF5677 domain-containing protein [Candidatus Neomarinimicrobiota bacterium]